MPAIEIEIGEEEDHQAGCEEDLRSRPPHLLVSGRDADELGQETEIDRHIGKHRPGECGSGGQH